jgi:hypothetical protein
MTKLDKMPQQSIIDQYKGLVDFYLYKGVAVARRWPKWEPRLPTPAEAANQAAFKLINQIFQSLPPDIHEAYTQMAAQTTRTSKDVAVSLYMLGDGTEMPPDYFASEQTQLLILAMAQAIDTLLDSKLDVLLSTRAVESGGNLAAIKTATETTDNLVAALGSVNTDDLQVDDKTDYAAVWLEGFLGDGRSLPADGSWVQLFNLSARGVLNRLICISEEASFEIFLNLTDGESYIPRGDGRAQVFLSYANLTVLGGDAFGFKVVNATGAYTGFGLQTTLPIAHGTGMTIHARSTAGHAIPLQTCIQHHYLV